ncbi:MAG: aryl-alcohol dehydrogenase-like predicted oxidoreductase [Saprospiraceae bacterium]|jgi:aryl-alcohol dehydrogenase-like predicted oxidoreductase
MMKNSKIGLGTAAIGRPLYINIKKETAVNDFSKEVFRQKGIDILETAYEQGIRYFDTAPGYGMAEQMLIDWVQEKEDTRIEIATKWGYTYVANFDGNATQHEVKEHSLAKLNEQWEKSKILLPSLTTYQIHSTTFETGVLENEAVLNRLAELRNKHGLRMGITTTGANQAEVLRKALDVKVNGEDLFNLFQVTYNIFDQSLASIATEISKQNKRLVIKEALANGRIFPNEKYSHYVTAYQQLKQLADKHNVGIDAIALRFCVDSIPIYKVLSGAANAQHLTDNIKVADFKLEEEDITALKALAINPTLYWNERKQLGWN